MRPTALLPEATGPSMAMTGAIVCPPGVLSEDDPEVNWLFDYR
jgi:hypothetical protein